MGTDLGSDTFILFPKRTFINGVGTLMDVRGASLTYNFSDSVQEADMRAMAADWHSVGQDLRTALETYKKELPQLVAVNVGR